MTDLGRPATAAQHDATPAGDDGHRPHWVETITRLTQVIDAVQAHADARAEDDARVRRNLIALTPYAIPELAPPFTPERCRELAPLLGTRVWRQVLKRWRDQGDPERTEPFPIVPAQRPPTESEKPRVRRSR